MEQEMTKKGAKSQADLEWGERTLCSDEGCIGVIGPNGRCNECGKPSGAAKARKPPKEKARKEEPPPTADADEESGTGTEGSSEEPEESASTTDLEWEKRTLCSDEGCIGVIGSDGRCKECGKPL